MYIGNSPTQKGYILYDLKTHDISVSKGIIFHENIFPLENSQLTSDLNIIKVTYEATKDHATHSNEKKHHQPPHING